MEFLPPSTAPPLGLMDGVGPAIGALVFVLVMQRVAEPFRRPFNAVLVGGASGAYLGGGFGPWELMYPIVATAVVYRGLTSYRFTGLAWLMHAAWDLPHHLWGNPIWPFMPTSSFGCVVFDTLIAVWFLAGAPALFGRRARDSLRAPGSVAPSSVLSQMAGEAAAPGGSQAASGFYPARARSRFPRWHQRPDHHSTPGSLNAI